MRYLIGMAAALLMLAGAALGQTAGRITLETGGETHVLAAEGSWLAPGGGDETDRQIEILAVHPDGTTMILTFREQGGRASDILFRLREPDTADRIGREWTQGRDFRVTLTVIRRLGEVLELAGRYRGNLVDPHRPGVRARVSGEFTLRLEPPVLSPASADAVPGGGAAKAQDKWALRFSAAWRGATIVRRPIDGEI